MTRKQMFSMTLTSVLSVALLIEVVLCSAEESVSAHQYPCGVCICSEEVGGTSANCTQKHLSFIPGNLPLDIVGLDISFNNIDNLNNSLQRYTHLTKVNASYNLINRLNSDEFVKLFDLTVLDLHKNQLSLSCVTYPNNLFRHQSNLSQLMINHNSEVEGVGLEYPDKSFSHLISLEYLAIDGLRNPVFGKGFRNLKHLTTLIIEGNCYMRTLLNGSFSNVPNIKFLSIKSCGLMFIEPASFHPLKRIQELDLSDNVNLGIPNFGLGMFGLQNSAIKILRANSLNTRHGTGVQVGIKDVRYLASTRLEEFHFDGNRVEIVEPEVACCLPSTLKKFSVRNNMVLFGIYVLTGSALTGLEWLDASLQHQSIAQPFSLQDMEDSSQRCQRFKRNLRKTEVNQDIPHLPIEYNLHSFKDNPWPGNFTIFIPPNGKFANFSHSKLNFIIPRIKFGPNKLRILDLSYNFFNRWEGPIIGFEDLENLDLSHNYCEYVSDEASMYMPSLKTLNVSYNYLGYKLTNKTLSSLRHLEVLDVSNNKIFRLPGGIFHNTYALRQLNLSCNYLTSWDVSIEHMKNLSELDLSYNYFENLPISLESQLQNLPLRNLLVHFNNNPVKCVCTSLTSLKWIQTNADHILIDFHNMSCTFLNGERRDMGNLIHLITELESLCAPYKNLSVMFGSLSIVLLALAVLISGFLYRFRWKLRYLYYIAVNRHRGHLLASDEVNTFEFDAFVSYADEDRGFVVQDMRNILEEAEELEERFRLCIHHRDFLAGEAIAANILKAINISRKTVVILTRNFLKSYWCRYEVEMAKMEGIYRGRNTLLIVVMEDIPVKDLPVDIVEVMRNDSYVEFTNDREGQKVFWENLKRAINNK